MQTKEIRDLVLETTKKFGNLAVAEINGHNFSGADIALSGKKGGTQVFRIMIIRYG